MNRKIIPSLMLSGCLAMTACLAIPAFPAQASQEIYHISEDDSPVEYHSPEEIRDFFHSRPFSRTQPDTFDEEPDLESETAGKLSGESVENALNTLNFIRYIAGISADVETSDYYENMAMAGAALMTKTGMEHKPKKPAGVSQEFYQLAYEGTSSSNLGQGYRNLSTAITDGWIDDGDTSNIDRIGHRRWCLDPRMQATGFGHAGSYTAMYSFDGTDNGYEDVPEMVLWPALNMPVEYFTGPWSISFDSSQYPLRSSDQSRIKITMTSEKTGKQYTISGKDTNRAGTYMNVETSNYGYGPALIFTPNVRFSAGDNVTVKITGLRNDSGYDGLQYTAHFFSLSSDEYDSTEDSGDEDTDGEEEDGGSGNSGTSGGSGSSNGFGSSDRTETSGGSEVSGLPSYVVHGTWGLNAEGSWTFLDDSGRFYKNCWSAIYNPYADPAQGQSSFDWFCFDENGSMRTGWFQDPDGSYYYLNSASDGTRGKMLTGWHWIPDGSGLRKCYYFNPASDGTRGKMLSGTVVDGNLLNTDGAWVIDGVVQTR